ncbi:Lrp/AsnC family transcriptional regulator [Natrialbaceae archaeon A-chndr2]
MSESINEEQRKILEALLEDPRASYGDIAETTGVPKSTVWYTKKRFEDDGLLQTMAFLQLTELENLKVGLVGGAINGDKENVLENVANHPNVWFLVDTIGPHAFTAGVVGDGVNEFQQAIDDLREFGAEGDHYGEVLNISAFGLDPAFIRSLTID